MSLRPVFALLALAACVLGDDVTITPVTNGGANVGKITVSIVTASTPVTLSCALYGAGATPPGLTDDTFPSAIATMDPTVTGTTAEGVFQSVAPGDYEVTCYFDDGSDDVVTAPAAVTSIYAVDFSLGTATFPGAGQAALQFVRDPAGAFDADTTIACRTSAAALDPVDSTAFWALGPALVSSSADGQTGPSLTIGSLDANKLYNYQCAAKVASDSSPVKTGTFTVPAANPAVTVTNGKGKVTVVVKRADWPAEALGVTKVVCHTQVPAGTAQSKTDLLALTTTTPANTGYTIIDQDAAVATAVDRTLRFTGLNPGAGKVYCAFLGDTSDAAASADINIQVVEMTMTATSPASGYIHATMKREDNANFDTTQGASATCLVTPDTLTLANADTGNDGIWNAVQFPVAQNKAGYRNSMVLSGDVLVLPFEGLLPDTYNVYCAFPPSTGSAIQTTTVVVAQDVKVVSTTGDNGRVIATFEPAVADAFSAAEDSVTCAIYPAAATLPATLTELWTVATAANAAGGYRVQATGLEGTASGTITFSPIVAGDYKVVCGFPTATNSAVSPDVSVTVTKAAAPTVNAVPTTGAQTTTLTLTSTTAETYGTVRCVVSTSPIADADLWTTVAGTGVFVEEFAAAAGTRDVVTGPGTWAVKCAWQNSDVVSISPATVDVPCPAGQGVTSGACAACAQGTYSLFPAATTYGACGACTAPKTTATTGADGADDCVCPAGSKNDGSGGCTECPVNTYSAAVNSADCTACDQGKVSAAGAIACICQDGTEPDGAGCKACEANHFSTGGAACQACPGQTISAAGAIICGCPAGHVREANDTCTACAVNQYLSAGACVNCPAGKHSGVGSWSVEQCCVDHSDWMDAPATCVCAVGYEMTNAVCTACPAGKYRKTATNNTACATCPLNTFSPAAGRSTDCLSCPAGLYSGAQLNLATTTCHCNATGTWVALTSVNSSSTCTKPGGPEIPVPSSSGHVVPTMALVIPLLLAVLTAF